MANLSLVFDLIARDGASGPFKNVGNAAERAGQQTSKFGTAMSGAFKLASGALLGAGLVEGFKALYNAADESRKIGNLTAQVIKSTGGAANVSAKQVSNLAAAIAKKTGVDDEAIQSGQNLLLTFTNVRNEVGKGNNIFDQATQTITDMSVALGQDTSSSAIQLGKALNDPIKGVTALQRVGVSFTASQKEQITTLVESGRTLDAQKLILAELGKEFGGAAEAAGTPLGKLQQRIGDLAEDLGGKLIPYVDKAATFLSDDLLPAAGAAADVMGDVLSPAMHLAGETLKFVYESGKGIADLFESLPAPLQVTVGALGAMAVLKGPLGSLFSTLKDVGETAYLRTLLLKDAVSGLGGAAGVAKGALGGLVGLFGGPWGLAVAAVAGSFALLNAVTEDNKEVTYDAADVQRDLADALRESKGVIDENVRATAAKSLQDKGILDIAEKAGIALPRVTDAILGNKDAYGEVSLALENYYNNRLIASGYEEHGKTTMHDQADAAKGAIDQFDILAGTLGTTAAGQAQLDAATGQTTSSMGPAAQAADQLQSNLQDTADAASDARQQTDLFKTSLDVLTGQNVSLLEVQAQLQNAFAAAKDAITDEGGAVTEASGALNLHTENGRKAADVLLDVRNSGNELISTMIQQGATTEEVQAKDAELRASFINTAKQMGISQTGAENLANQILGIPAERTTQIKADTSQATTAIATLQDGIKNLQGRTVKIDVETGNVHVTGVTGSGTLLRAEGGPIYGPGTGTSDSIPAMLSNGEHVLTAREVRAAGGHSAIQSWRKSLVAGYADGGPVLPATIAAELDTRGYEAQMNTAASQVAKKLEPVTGLIGALNWARSQVGKPYIWGAAGPGGYDCSGFMSAITNVIRRRSPYSRVGSTANFPWAGFAGGYGLFTIGSTPNAGGGIGHMAGTLLGVNVESTGGVGVKVGGSARGAGNSLFSTRAHIAMANGGVIGEPVSGVGHYSGRSYSFGERGPETVTPGLSSGPQEVALRGPLDLSDATIDRLAVAMMRGAGSVVLSREAAQARAVASRPR